MFAHLVQFDILDIHLFLGEESLDFGTEGTCRLAKDDNAVRGDNRLHFRGHL